ncbi:MAG: peptidylprolyl isomerase [Planctomycetes bacterium]|nr:peptidylprolyl isomerase [Planctomycetota bacterium]
MSEPLTIAAGRVVSIHYKLTLDDGSVVDSSAGGEPLDYLHGTQSIVVGLERALEGRTIGERFDVAVSPEDGYGLPDPNAVQDVPRRVFPPDANLRVGMSFQARDENQNPIMGTIRKMVDDQITVDFNHPLAGRRLHFAIEVSGVREATAQERSHGHVHGHGHDH